MQYIVIKTLFIFDIANLGLYMKILFDVLE